MGAPSTMFEASIDYDLGGKCSWVGHTNVVRGHKSNFKSFLGKETELKSSGTKGATKSNTILKLHLPIGGGRINHAL